MASAQEPCQIRLVAENPSGDTLAIFEKRVEETSGGGNSADGTISISYEKWPFLAPSGPPLGKDVKLRLQVKLDATDGIDVSDGKVIIPYTDAKGNARQLTQASFGLNAATYDLPAASPINVWLDVGTAYTIVEDRIQIGHPVNGKYFVSIEDDTA